MSCRFCLKESNRDYLLSKKANYCMFCGDSLHEPMRRDRSGSKVYMNLKEVDGRRICPNCGAVVTRSDPRAVYCSLECQSQYNGKVRRERKRRART